MVQIAKNFQIVFHCNAGGILKRTVQFGEEETDEDSIEGGSTEYSQDFLTEQLCRITKLSGLSNNMQIYPGKPLLFRSNVGSLGKISIYINIYRMTYLEGETGEKEGQERQTIIDVYINM